MDMNSLDFLTDEVDDITLSQICEIIETEHHVFEGLQNLSFCDDSNAGAADSCSMDFDCRDIMTLMDFDVQKTK